MQNRFRKKQSNPYKGMAHTQIDRFDWFRWFFFFWRTEVVSHVYRLKICLTVAFGAAEMSPMQVMFTEHSIKLT